ncbi:hypothetical protein [Caproicibacter sp. BJN0012]|uniref:hypothetical protein n=1 Tax=Caproicibacter sp. BJN0012 TaxID=3110227 RepID=UPI002E112496
MRQSPRQGGIPLEITTKADGFYNPANLKRLNHSTAQMEQGNTVAKSMDDWEEWPINDLIFIIDFL